MRLHVQGCDLDLLYQEGVRPTVFSLFLANSLQVTPSDRHACDLGTGGGILAIALARLGVEKVTAVDRSALACEVARENVLRNGVSDRVEVIHGDIGELTLPCCDLAVSNPPTMPPVDAVPGFAAGGTDPLEVIGLIAANLGSWLQPGGRGQIALSSLVACEALDAFQAAGFVATPEASLLAPFRPFYREAYSAEELESFRVRGRALSEGAGPRKGLQERITAYTLRPRSDGKPSS